MQTRWKRDPQQRLGEHVDSEWRTWQHARGEQKAEQGWKIRNERRSEEHLRCWFFETLLIHQVLMLFQSESRNHYFECNMPSVYEATILKTQILFYTFVQILFWSTFSLNFWKIANLKVAAINDTWGFYICVFSSNETRPISSHTSVNLLKQG